MPQIFGRHANGKARASIGVAGLIVVLTGYGVWAVWWSPHITREDMALDQPVPFSHQHHVSGLGIDCRYCHATVEKSAMAGMPSTETCMTCHSQVWTEAPMLAPVRESWASGNPLKWNRVHDLPDFTFFNHSIHVQKGIGCSTCHGRVDQMPLVWKSENLWMKWCMDCHENPAPQIRPQEQVFNMAYESTNQAVVGPELRALHNIHTGQIRDCSVCHR